MRQCFHFFLGPPSPTCLSLLRRILVLSLDSTNALRLERSATKTCTNEGVFNIIIRR